MSLPIIKYCPSTLTDRLGTYSVTALRNIFGGHKVSHILPFVSPQNSEEMQDIFIENIKHVSISGVQEKLFLIQEKNKLRLTLSHEQSTHILKPISKLPKGNMLPANEHLTMQIASQVFGINTAKNAIIFFMDGVPAYITKRFDLKPNGMRFMSEDFATLLDISKTTSGDIFKYDSSYEEMGRLIKEYTLPWKIETQKYFSLVVFNYLVSNGDAHLKNFSLLETKLGDYLLSPAYDLINTRMHVKDTIFGVDKGLFEDNFKSSAYKKNNYPSAKDFIEFGKRIGIKKDKVEKILTPFLKRQPLQEELVKRSFLNEESKKGYQIMYNTRRNYLTAK